MTIKLTHLGEPLIAEILSSLTKRGELARVRCAKSGTRLVDDLKSAVPQFLPDEAVLRIESAGRTFYCDGAQTVDILCAGEGLAVAMEAKLGDTRMTLGAFRARFCGKCRISRHGTPKLNGSMVAVLDGYIPFTRGRTVAAAEAKTWPLSKIWWLVVRRSVYEKWDGKLPTRRARVLVFDDLVRLYGDRHEFDALVRRVIGGKFAANWSLGLE